MRNRVITSSLYNKLARKSSLTYNVDYFPVALDELLLWPNCKRDDFIHKSQQHQLILHIIPYFVAKPFSTKQNMNSNCYRIILCLHSSRRLAVDECLGPRTTRGQTESPTTSSIGMIVGFSVGQSIGQRVLEPCANVIVPVAHRSILVLWADKSAGHFKGVTWSLILWFYVYFYCKQHAVNCTIKSRRDV